MTAAITMEELLAWDQESSTFWKAHLEANPALLELPCGIGGTANVQDFVRHIWGGELIFAQRIAGLPVIERKNMPAGPLDALFDMHLKAVELLGASLADDDKSWEETITLEYAWLPPHARTFSRRKALAHTLLHGHRHWAQLATLVRAAGFPSTFKGDLLFSLVMK
jgi:uncharacterized damage-inducible protein DinB